MLLVDGHMEVGILHIDGGEPGTCLRGKQDALQSLHREGLLSEALVEPVQVQDWPDPAFLLGNREVLTVETVLLLAWRRQLLPHPSPTAL